MKRSDGDGAQRRVRQRPDAGEGDRKSKMPSNAHQGSTKTEDKAIKMTPPVLEGASLGEKHKHYNKILKDTLTKTKSSNPGKVNIEDVDIHNLLKIDMANSNKNVEYILEVLKSEDMLYVSRAIKRCTWLITEPQYAHIVNPHYLHTQLFPQMTAKASSKLILHIKLNLRDETRVEGFYKHFKHINKSAALRWLPYCSLPFIEKEVENYKGDIDLQIFKRLCKRSFSILEIYLRKYDNMNYMKGIILVGTKFLIHTHTEKMFDFLATAETYQWANFGPRITNSIMKKCPQKILDNFPKYCQIIDLKTFVKHLKREDIKHFLLKYAEKESMKYWFKFDNLKHFIKRMPIEGRFEFLKTVFIDKTHKSTKEISDDVPDDGGPKLLCARTTKNVTSSANIYLWYRFASFDVAFPDLKKLIRFESSPVERNAMLGVLASCAGRNLQHMHTLLQYYHDKHINEPFRFKIQFVNNVLSQSDTHLFDVKTWSTLNNIFCSLEVYMVSENNVQQCIQSIIVYKVLHGETVPEIVEKKFTFDTLKSQEKKLNKEEKEKVFSYLYNIILTKIQNKNIQNEATFAEVLQFLESVLNLLMEWNRELIEYPLVIDEIKKLVEIKVRNSWTVDISTLYNKKKSWRKQLFEDSLTLYPKESACVNALKHDSDLFQRRRSEVEELCRNDRVSLDRLLSKMRIYWPESLAREWTDWYLGSLNSPGGHKALVRGLCVLLPQKQLVDIVRKYAPTESKITWSEDNDIELNLRKQFARKLYIARPLPSLELVLMYAQGDYLQFALSSLNAIMYNLSPEHSHQYIVKLLDAPVSLKKHGIRLAFMKLESKELKQMFSSVWKSTKNSTIRAVLFKETHNLLCREKNASMIEEIWELLSMFIDNLSSDEDKTIFDVLGKVDKVPLVVRGRFFMKGYKYLKSLPAKANCENIITSIENHARGVMEFIDPDFVADILLESINKKFATKRYGHTYIQILSSYLLCAKDTNSQSQRYEKVLVPFLDICIDQWTLKIENDYFAREALNELVRHLSSDIQIYALEQKMIIPVKVFSDMLTKLEGRLSILNNYIILRNWKLTVAYVKLLQGQQERISSITGDIHCSEADIDYNRQVIKKWNDLYLTVAPEFAQICIMYLKDDIKSYFPSVYLLFAEALKNMFCINMSINQMVYLEYLKLMLGDTVESYLVVLVALPDTYFNNDEEKVKYSEILEIIRGNSSPEIKMHYSKRFGTYEADSEN